MPAGTFFHSGATKGASIITAASCKVAGGVCRPAPFGLPPASRTARHRPFRSDHESPVAVHQSRRRVRAVRMESTLAPEFISVIISVAVIATKFNAFRSGFDAAYRLH